MRTFFIVLLCICSLQSKGQVCGYVQDEAHAPVMFALVITCDSAGKTINGSVSDSTGYFCVRAGSAAQTLRVTAMGYDTALILLHNVAVDSLKSMDTLILHARSMNVVQITAVRPLFVFMSDRTIMNVADQPAATGNSIYELLRKCPGVRIDPNGQILMRGTPAAIYFDGRKSQREGSDLLDYLRNTPADVLDKIEIITNPSSRYDAEGGAGIINLVFRKNAEDGTNGRVSLSSGYGRYAKGSMNGSLNYRKNKFNLFGGAYIGAGKSFNELYYNSVMHTDSSALHQDRFNYWNPANGDMSFSLGADFGIGRSVFGIRESSNVGLQKETNRNISSFYFENEPVHEVISSLQKRDKSHDDHTLNLNLTRETDSLGGMISADIDVALLRGTNSEYNRNLFTGANGLALRNPYHFRNTTSTRVALGGVKVDYMHFLDSSLFYETGCKASYVENDNNLLADSLAANGWSEDRGRTNHFLYNELMLAGYAQVSKTYTRWSVQAGVRTEFTKYTANSFTAGRKEDSLYVNLFPSVFVTLIVDSTHALSFSYSRRIDRPAYQDLNPFIQYIDPYTVFAGNPFLKPSLSDKSEVRLAVNNFFFVSLSYTYSRLIQDNVVEQDADSGITKNTMANVGHSNWLGADANILLDPFSFLHFDVSVYAYFNNSVSVYPGFEYNSSGYLGGVTCDNSFALPRNIKIVATLYYDAPYREGIRSILPFWGGHLSVQKAFADNRGRISIRWNNALGMPTYRAHLRNETLDIYWSNQWEGRRVTVSLSWKFGSATVKANREREGASSEERNRVRTD